jgi:hypothetical protein
MLSEQREPRNSPLCSVVPRHVQRASPEWSSKPFRWFSDSETPLLPPFPAKARRPPCIEASSPFHIALLEQILRFCASRASRPAKRNAYFLPLSKINAPSSVAGWNVSAPGGAPFRFGAEAAKGNPLSNKKPGVERRAIPSFPQAVLRPSERKNSKLDSYYPVLVTNLTSRSATQTRLSAHSRAWQTCADIRKLYRNPKFRQAVFNFLLSSRRTLLWISLRFVEIRGPLDSVSPTDVPRSRRVEGEVSINWLSQNRSDRDRKPKNGKQRNRELETVPPKGRQFILMGENTQLEAGDDLISLATRGGRKRGVLEVSKCTG